MPGSMLGDRTAKRTNFSQRLSREDRLGQYKCNAKKGVCSQSRRAMRGGRKVLRSGKRGMKIPPVVGAEGMLRKLEKQ